MPKIIDHDKRRREIVDVAKRLMLEGGFEAATMRSIAAEAGFANGALKHYFPGKDSIIAATFESVLAEMDPEGALDNLDVPEGADPAQVLRDRLRQTMPLTDYAISAGRVLLVLWDHAASNPELAKIYRDFLQRWQSSTVSLLKYAQKGRAQSTDEELDALALEIISITIGANVVNLMHPKGEQVATYHQIIDNIIKRTQG
ncbi:TetR family transcriptional regulator [Maritalea mobilis]|uniref:TetR family transcriptional regulator n=1 Tax=Maritalea mobilis TaxID=483324 RepID=A0A4V3DAJ4_9HYPH|nr:TetR family transcriptional regulator [Maritalea mobilis]TDQ62040.1 TetR family transcriptional regulator [Maritalea mobilis]